MESSLPAPPDGGGRGESSRALRMFVRVLVPGALVVGGVVLAIMGHGRYTSVFADRDSLYSAAGVALWVTAIGVWLLDWLLGMNSSDTDDRAREESARRYFISHGHWPGEGGSGSP
ncbi:MAG: hypothetical protein ACRDKL_04585 [Solirubrobacteraceae bacterium]